MEEAQKEIKPVPIPKVPEAPPVDRKTELQQKKAKNRDHLPPAEEKELQEILAEEKRAHDREALLFKLRERADHYGRKEMSKIKREITDQVAGFSTAKAVDCKTVNDMIGSALKELDKLTKKAMQKVQEAHNQQRSEILNRQNEELAAISKKYQAQFDVAEAELERRLDEAGQAVHDFQACLDALTLEQLTELDAGGTVKLPNEKGEVEFLVIPGEDPPK